MTIAEEHQIRPTTPKSYEAYLQGLMPEGRRPYIMARLVFMTLFDYPGRRVQPGDKVTSVLETLQATNRSGDLQPPLSPELANEIDILVQEIYCKEHALSQQSATTLLAWVIDHGSMETFSAAGHLEAHVDPRFDGSVAKEKSWEAYIQGGIS